MTASGETFQSAWIADLKAQPTLIALLPNGTGNEIREAEWQGTDFDYPNVRVGVDFMPSIEGCGPEDADVLIEVSSDEKSSKVSAHIAAVIEDLYHKHPFTRNGIRFSTVIVRKVERPNRSIMAWVTKINIFTQGI